MLLSAIPPQTPLRNPNNLTFCPNHKPQTQNLCRSSNPNPNLEMLRNVTNHTASDESMVPSATAVAAAIRAVSSSPVEFMQRIEKDSKNGLVLPSSDFQGLCVEQLNLFRRIVHSQALLSVYVRPAGSYVMDRLELRRVAFYPGVNGSDIVILICNFSIPTGLRAAEAALLNQQVEFIPDRRAVLFPMVKHPFVVGFLVAELPMTEQERPGSDLVLYPTAEEMFDLPLYSDLKSRDVSTEGDKGYMLTAVQRSNAINIARTLAMAYVMDQKALLLQQSSWQNNVRMTKLVEQIRGPLSSIRTLSKMLSVHTKRSEVSHDIVEDILVQGDRMRETLQQLQDAVYMTKANIMRYNEESLRKMQNPTYVYPESMSQLSNDFSRETSGDEMQKSGEPRPTPSAIKDLEMPMPPLALAPLQERNIRPCVVSDILADLVGAIEPLARKQQRVVELSELSGSLEVAVEEPALRQALSNLIEGSLLRIRVGGKVEILSTRAPAGGALIVIDDDGPDMHYMTQMHSLTPFGADLLCNTNMIEDNLAWNFVAGMTVAREILESYGCVVRVISPRVTDAALGTGGTRIELWLPSFTVSSDFSDSSAHEA